MNLRRPLSALFSLNALVWLAMLTGLAALLCFAAAGWLALAPRMGAPLAALCVGLGLLAVAALLGLMVYKTTHQPKPKPEPAAPPPAEARLEDGLRPLIGDSAIRWTRQHTAVVAFGALAAGVVLAASPGIRRMVIGAAGPTLTRKAMRIYHDISPDHD